MPKPLPERKGGGSQSLRDSAAQRSDNVASLRRQTTLGPLLWPAAALGAAARSRRYAARVHRHGTTYEERAGRLVRIVDRTGVVHATLAWDGDALVQLDVPGAQVRGAVVADPLLGSAHEIVGATTMSPVAWARPTEIPAIAAPGQLRGGAGAPLMNTIAVLAVRAGVGALRYAGPYPTTALWRALARSFTTSCTEAEFTADALPRALRIARDELPFEFCPAPHERVAIPGGHVELRMGVERVVLNGVGYGRDAAVARLVEDGARVRAEVWFGDARWAHVATLGADGQLEEGPHELPRCASPVVGKTFPAALREAIAELVAELVPSPLAADARAALVGRAITWADLGARAAGTAPDGFVVHAALWERLAPAGMGRVALALAEALAPVVAMAIVAEVGVMSR